MEDFDTRILVDAKEEYSKELIRVLKRYMLEGIESLYSQACELCHKNRSKTIVTFQDLLEQIPKWNQELIEKETNRIIENSKCEFFEDLITAVFVSHTKILAAIRTNKKNKRINLTIPKPETFVHKCYIEAAREFWKSPCMFDKKVSNFEQQRNNKYCEDIISVCIQETIRKLLPLKYILKESLGESYDDDQSSDSDDITKSISKSEESNLKKLVQNEIKNHYSGKSNSDTEISSNDKDIDFFDKDFLVPEKKNEKEELKKEKVLKETEDKEDVPIQKNKEDTNEKKENNNENLVKDIKIQEGGSSLFPPNNSSETNVSKIDPSENNTKTIDIDTIDEKLTSDNNKSIEIKSDESPLPCLENSNSSNVSLFSDLDKNNSSNEIKSDVSLVSDLDKSNSPTELNLDSIQIPDDLPSLNDVSNSDINLNELDIGSLVKNDSVVKLDGNYNMVDSNDLYNNLNKDSTIKTDIIQDFNNNSRTESRPNLFDDAPLTD